MHRRYKINTLSLRSYFFLNAIFLKLFNNKENKENPTMQALKIKWRVSNSKDTWSYISYFVGGN